MKTVLFLAFLALGPALADQMRLVPRVYTDSPTSPVAAASTEPIAVALAHGTAAHDRAWLCGR
jgi:hypothetical protein